MTARPRHFVDDGSVVTVDLHGCSVRDGLYVARRSIQEAYRRGRAKVDVIHGTSTSLGSGDGPTIKNELLQYLRSGQFNQWASGFTMDASGGRTTVWIHLGASRNPERIQLKHVLPP